MRFLLCVNEEGGMNVIKGDKVLVAEYIQNDIYGKHLLASVLDWVEQSQVGDFLETGNYVIARVKDENPIL